MPHDYRFMPVTRDDYPMLRGWLAEPHIGGWWGDGWVETKLMDEDMETGMTDMRIVWHAPTRRPFAYVQDYPVRAFDAPHYGHLPDDARALDMFLGDPAYLGQGHARRFLRAHARQILEAGAEAVLVDPDPANTRAVATFRGAGFIPVAQRKTTNGAPALVMRFTEAVASEGL